MMKIENKSIENHFTILLKCYKIFKTPIGFQRIKLVRGKITYPGKFYKIYCIILSFITYAAAYIAFGKNFIPNLSHNIPYPLMISLIINIISVVIGYLALLIDSLYFSNENYGKMYNLLLKTAHELNFGCAKQCQIFKIILFFVHVLIFIVKILFFIPDLKLQKSWYSLSGHFMVYVNDLETMHFIIETNLIAKLFENLNKKLILFSKNKFSAKSGFLIKIWKSNSKIDTRVKNQTILQLIQICDSLFDIINSLNYSYMVLVIIYFYRIILYTNQICYLIIQIIFSIQFLSL